MSKATVWAACLGLAVLLAASVIVLRAQAEGRSERAEQARYARCLDDNLRAARDPVALYRMCR